MLKTLKIINGRWRLLFGLCPECNSDAPELYDCPVCEYKRAPKQYWWVRFMDNLNNRPMPTFVISCPKKGCKYKGTKAQLDSHLSYSHK